MSDYLFDLITKTGNSIPSGSNLTGLGNTPSINDFGLVAFVGEFDSGTDLLAEDALGNVVNLSGSYSLNFSNQVEINNNNQVVARDSVSGLQAIRIWDVGLPSSYRVAATGGFPADGLDFEWIYLFPSINNSDQVVFVADPKDGGAFNTALATPSFVGSENYNEAIVPSALIKPAIADNGTVVARESNSIRLNDYQLNPIAVIASNFSGFDSLGLASNISNDGKAVAFYGDLVNPGATSTTQGLDAGEGIFISLETDTGREIK